MRPAGRIHEIVKIFTPPTLAQPKSYPLTPGMDAGIKWTGIDVQVTLWSKGDDMSETQITDEELLVLAASNFNGELPVPQVHQRDYECVMYRTFYTLLKRIKALEASSVTAKGKG